MSTRSLGRSVTAVQKQTDPTDGFRFAVVIPEAWPPAVLAAYDAATVAGDHDFRADIVAAQTGIRPSVPRPGAPLRHRTPPIIEIRSRRDGPQ